MEEEKVVELINYLTDPAKDVGMTSVDEIEDVTIDMLKPALPGVKATRLFKAFQGMYT